MLAPDLVEVVVAEYREEHAMRVVRMRRERGAAKRPLANAPAAIDHMVAAVASGGGTFEPFRDAIDKVRDDREAALVGLGEQDALPPVALHPAIVGDDRRQVANLQAALADPEAGPRAATALRALIDHMVLTPNPDGRGVCIQVEGRLAGIAHWQSGVSRRRHYHYSVKLERVKGIEPSS